MPARGAFSDKRKAFLESKRGEFSAAVENNHTADGLAVIFRQYFKRFPIDLNDNKEPSEEALAAVDDNAPDPEIEEPSESLGPEEYAAALEALKDCQARIQAKRGQITRWFTYRYPKDHNVDPCSNDPKNPYNALLLQLTGNLAAAKPRRKAPVNVWVHDQSSTQPIKDEIQQILNGRHVDCKQMVAVRSQAARVAFRKLSEDDQEKWKRAADAEYEKLLADYERVCKGVVSTNPEDRQRAINGLVRFVQPILDRIALVTGFKVSLFAGGPEPARQGRLSLISMHSGTTGGDAPLNFGQAERVAYMKFIMPIWGRFMRACYTPEECRSRALPAGTAENSLQSAAMDEEGTSFHSFGLPQSDVPAPPTNGSKFPLADVPSNHPVSRPSTSTTNPLNTDIRQSGIAGITEAIRDVQRRVEESVARSVASSLPSTPRGSLPPSVVPSPIPSALPSPACPPAAKRTRALSAVDPSPKRPRASILAPPSCVVPPDAPIWVSSAINMFVSESLEGHWQELVAAWLVYEGRRNFEGKKLSPKGRPKIVAEWIKWARKPTWRPSSLPRVEDIDREHTLWWKSLQPAWRMMDDGMLSRSGAGGWDSLNVGGPNGLLSALASLFFWGLAVRRTGGNFDSWNAIVEDTLYVIQLLTRDLE